MPIDGDKMAQVRKEGCKLLDLEESVKTIRKLEMFGNGKCDFEFPSVPDVLTLLPVEREHRLVAIHWKEDSVGIAAIRLIFANGVESPLFTAQNISAEAMQRVQL